MTSKGTNLGEDLERITRQERRLWFERFDAGTAWELGSRLKMAAEVRGAALVIDVGLCGWQLFHCAMPGTTPDNADWARRKRNTVLRFHRSSYAVGLSLQRQGTTLEAKAGVPLSDYATHGGGFPILLAGQTCIGAITVSGLPQREDHELIVAVLAEYLGHPLAELALS
jgi:uncharacterized protein (UPF0303 family)